MKNFYTGKRVLITGAGGFIGSHLTQALISLNAKVTALVHYNGLNSWGHLEEISNINSDCLSVVSGDITDYHFIRRIMENQDIVFHLAALITIPYSYSAPVSYVKVNIEGTLNMLEAMRETKTTRMIHTSTSETYGTAQYTPIDEAHPLQGQSPYSASKIGADKMVESYYRSFNVPVVTIRPFNTYGPRQSARAVIPTIAAQLASNFSVLKLGTLKAIRDMNFVFDTVNGFLLAGASDKNCLGQVINIGAGRGVTIKTIAKILMQIARKKIPIECDEQRIRPEKSEVFNLVACNKLAKTLLGWTPQVTLEKGLRITYDYVKNNLTKYRSNIYNI
jgi:NAD dependent epimerase/dehydratase